MALAHTLLLTTIALGCSAITLGCSRSNPADPAPPLERAEELTRMGPTAPSARGGGPPSATSRDAAIERVAIARCDQLKSCGPNALTNAVDSVESCRARERAHVEVMWRGAQCAQVDATMVETCVRAASSSRCDVDRETLFAPIVGACAPTSLCSQPAP